MTNTKLFVPYFLFCHSIRWHKVNSHCSIAFKWTNIYKHTRLNPQQSNKDHTKIESSKEFTDPLSGNTDKISLKMWNTFIHAIRHTKYELVNVKMVIYLFVCVFADGKFLTEIFMNRTIECYVNCLNEKFHRYIWLNLAKIKCENSIFLLKSIIDSPIIGSHCFVTFNMY